MDSIAFMKSLASDGINISIEHSSDTRQLTVKASMYDEIFVPWTKDFPDHIFGLFDTLIEWTSVYEMDGVEDIDYAPIANDIRAYMDFMRAKS
jgi:hypothetical protein